MATLYVRDVPERLYKRLRTRARNNGRSLNAEVIEILDGVVDQEREGGSITDKLRELAMEINLPDDAPMPEDLIREARDGRERRFRR